MKTFKNAAVYLTALLTMVSTASALEHQELMWGIKNTGRSFSVDVDPLQAYRIQGVVGQDINLMPPVSGRKVKVAVIDTGVDITHPDLKNFIVKNANKCEAYQKLMECTDGGKTDTLEEQTKMLECRTKILVSNENVYPGDCFGWSVLDGGLSQNGKAQMTPNGIIGRPDFKDVAGHGTHVAGTILSVTQNIEIIPVQVIGDGPNKPLQPYSIDLAPNENIRGGFQTRTNLSERVARGMIYAMSSGAEVINFSMGWPEDQNTDIIRETILEAQRRNIIIVAAAGNDSTSALLRPCQYKNVICVAASRPDGALAAFSNYGLGVDIAAPGIEILSTIPLAFSSVRLPGFAGYDYLSGTSQATPYVSGVIAEMLSRGIPAQDIYPRLILGARAIQKELPVLKGPVNSPGVPVNAEAGYQKNILSGLLDMQRSMQVTPQPLLLPADKETQVIAWDRKSANLSFQFKIKNYWKNLDKAVSVQVRSTIVSDIEPAIIQADIIDNKGKSWATNEERTVKVGLQIRDNKNPSLSRIPRELSYQVYVLIDGKTHRQFEVKAEVIASFSKQTSDPDIMDIPIFGQVQAGLSLTPVDEVYDNDQLTKDYFTIGRNDKDKGSFDIALMKLTNGRYEIQPTQTIKFNGNLDLWRPRYKIRMDMDGDGISEYVFGVIEYLDKNLGIEGPYRNHFFVFDGEMHLKQTLLFDDKRVAIPVNFYWMKIGQSMRPAWVGQGPEIKKNWDITDLWNVTSYENVPTKKDIRLFFLDENFKLAHMAADANSRIVDMIQPTLTQIKAGILPVLIAKNLGTELKPSYLNTFAVGEVQNAQLIRQRGLNMFASKLDYRNLVDTMTDKTFSTNTSATEFKGTMWYGLDAHKKQRVTLLDLDESKIFDKLISSQRVVFDAPLLVRWGFQSKDRAGVFLITNSEIEYHDLIGSQVASRSLNRYSFMGLQTLNELLNPITIIDRQFPNKKLPGLYAAEGTGIGRGIKMMVPVYSEKGLLQKIVAPARLSFKAAEGCKSLANPLFMGEGQGYAIDYYCGDQMKRLLLKY